MATDYEKYYKGAKQALGEPMKEFQPVSPFENVLINSGNALK